MEFPWKLGGRSAVVTVLALYSMSKNHYTGESLPSFSKHTEQLYGVSELVTQGIQEKHTHFILLDTNATRRVHL